MNRMPAFLALAVGLAVVGDAAAQSRDRESRSQGGERPRSREDRPREERPRDSAPRVPDRRDPGFPSPDGRRDTPPPRRPDPIPQPERGERLPAGSPGRAPERGGIPSDTPFPAPSPSRTPRGGEGDAPRGSGRPGFPPVEEDRRPGTPPGTRDPRDVREVRDRDGRVWEERRWPDSRGSETRAYPSGRGSQPRWEVRDRDGWRSAPPVRSRETIVLRDSRPYGRPWIVYSTPWGFGGLWQDYTCAPLYSFTGITIVNSSWCPGRGRFAYVELSGGRRVVRIYEPGWSAPRPLLGGFDTVDHLSWSPDGRYLAFVTRSGGEDCLNILDTVTDRIERITYGFPRCAFPTWHPSGRYLFFLSDRFGSTTLFRVAPWGGAPIPCDGFPGGPVNRMLLAPDGSTLLFGLGLGGNRTEIWSYRTDLSYPAHPLVRIDGGFDNPAFLNGGDRVFYRGSAIGGGYGWYSFGIEGGEVRFHGDDPGRWR